MVCLGRPFYFKLFKGCLPQILLGSFLNTLSHLKWLNQRKNVFVESQNLFVYQNLSLLKHLNELFLFTFEYVKTTVSK